MLLYSFFLTIVTHEYYYSQFTDVKNQGTERLSHLPNFGNEGLTQAMKLELSGSRIPAVSFMAPPYASILGTSSRFPWMDMQTCRWYQEQDRCADILVPSGIGGHCGEHFSPAPSLILSPLLPLKEVTTRDLSLRSNQWSIQLRFLPLEFGWVITLEQEAECWAAPKASKRDSMVWVGWKHPSWPQTPVPQSSGFNEASGQVRSQSKFQACFAHTALEGPLASLCQIYRHIWISFLKFQPPSFAIFLPNTFLLWLEKLQEHLPLSCS